MNIKSVPLGKRIINDMSKPYVIAEIGVNHEGSMKTAKKLIELAKEEERMLQNFKLIRLLL